MRSNQDNLGYSHAVCPMQRAAKIITTFIDQHDPESTKQRLTDMFGGWVVSADSEFVDERQRSNYFYTYQGLLKLMDDFTRVNQSIEKVQEALS